MPQPQNRTKLVLYPLIATAMLLGLVVSCADAPTAAAGDAFKLEPTPDSLSHTALYKPVPEGKVGPNAKKIIRDTSASDGKAAALYRTGEGVSFKLSAFQSGTYTVKVRARGDVYQGPPEMRLSLNGKRIGSDKPVATKSYTDYLLGDIALEQDQVLKVMFTNDKWDGSRDKDRNLYIDYLDMTPTGYEPPTPTPEPTDPEPTEPGAPVSVSVDWNNGLYQTTPFSYGLNLFQGFDPELARSPRYNDNLAYMNPGLVRYHSWEMMGDSKSTRNGWIDRENRRWDAEKIHRALGGPRLKAARAINIPSWPSWMDANGDEFLDADQVDAFAAWCAELVRIVNKEYKHEVEYWEPTNERDNLYYVQFNGGPDRLDELIDIYNRAARAMKAVDETIKVGGPAFTRPDLVQQVERFVAGTANQSPRTLDFLSIHGYASGDRNDSDTQIYNRVLNADDPAAGSRAKTAADVRGIVDRVSRGRRIPVWFDEYNISWTYTNNDPRMQNHKGAVYDALAVVHFADAGMDATAAWNEQDGIYGKADNDGVLRPSAHVFHLMNAFMVGRRVATDSGDPAAVVPFAVRDDSAGTRSVLLINRSNTLQEIVADFGGWRPRSEVLSRYEVSASGFSQTTVAASDLSGTLAIPPHSVTLIVDKRRNRYR